MMTKQQESRCEELWGSPRMLSKRAIMQLLNLEAKQAGQPPVERDDVWCFIMRDLCSFSEQEVQARGIVATPSNKSLERTLNRPSQLSLI